jgi:hypothetical protein
VPPLTNLDARGPHNPVASTPRRVAGSIRRTSSIDTTRPDGIAGRMVMEGRARDAVTAVDGAGVTLGDARVIAEVHGATRELATFRTDPEVAVLQSLLGVVVGPGFRARMDEVVPEQREQHSLLYLLLDDLPGAGLVSGYAMLRADAVPRGRPDEYLGARADLCAGWASDGSMMVMLREHGQNPTPLGPPAPRLTRPDDPIGWHDISDLPPMGMRRLRRIDVIPPAETNGPHRVDVFFRDSYFDDAAAETVVHEYSVGATVDGETRTVLTIDATANVLPWQECPAAIASATRLVGHGLGDLRPWVRETFVGTTTCTHLNDVLRGLTDVGTLLDQLAAVGSPHLDG